MGAAGARFGTSGNGYCRSGVMAVYDDLPFKKLVDRLGPSALPTSGDYSEAVFEQYRQFAAYRKEVDGMEWYALNLNAPGNYNKQFALKYDPSYDCRVTNLGGNRKYWNGSGFSTYAGSLTENGLSATILVSYGDFDYYTGADCACQTGVMQQIASGLGRPVDAMKAGHHLYYDTIDAATAAILQPQVTIAQILDKDKPGDPAFSLYRQQGDVFCTNLHPWRLKPVSELAEGEGIKAGKGGISSSGSVPAAPSSMSTNCATPTFPTLSKPPTAPIIPGRLLSFRQKFHRKRTEGFDFTGNNPYICSPFRALGGAERT